MHICGQLYTGTKCETNTNNDLCVNLTSVGMAKEANEWYDSATLHWKGVSTHWIMDWNMEWNMEWNGGMENALLNVRWTA